MIDFTKVYRLIDSALYLDENTAWIFAFDNETKEHIIWLNTEYQLHEKGLFSDGTSTSDYSPVTVRYKIQKGQRYDHMTFKDTGGFYDSFFVRVDANGFIIDADGQVSSETNLFDVYGQNIAGLTDENMDWLVEVLTEKYLIYAKKQLGIL